MKAKPYWLSGACLFLAITLRVSAQTPYPFQDPNLPMEQRVNSVISLMTVEEKVAFLTSGPSVSRLGIQRMGHMKGFTAWRRVDPAIGEGAIPIPRRFFRRPTAWPRRGTRNSCVRPGLRRATRSATWFRARGSAGAV